MKVVLQRVTGASVTVEGMPISSIGKGLLVLLGICKEDGEREIDYLVKKIVSLRIFDDEKGVMNHSLKEISGDILVVSQFTLMARTKGGNRPSYIDAAKREISKPLYDCFCEKLETTYGRKIKKGSFGESMQVSLVNDGPVTILIDTEENLLHN